LEYSKCKGTTSVLNFRFGKPIYNNLLRELLVHSDFPQINLQEVACIVIFAVIVAFLIDFPAQEIGLLILDFNFSDPLLPNTKENAGDGENPSNEESSDLKSDSPEPVDSIWPSESDPEDEKSSE